MFKLSVLLCLSLYFVMAVYGNGPSRADGRVRAETAGPVASGIRIKPALEPTPRPATLAAAPEPQMPQEVLAREVLATVAKVAPVSADSVVNAQDALPANVELRWVTAGTANVRAAPNKRSALSGKIGQGEAVHVMWTEPNGWVRVRAAVGDVSGFVHKSLLTDTAPATASVTLATAD